MFLDYSVYPDLEQLPDTLDSPEQKADYPARVCGVWDFGIVPTAETFALFQQIPVQQSRQWFRQELLGIRQ